MKKLLIVFALLFAVEAYATGLSKVSFQPYSSATQVTCVVYGMEKLLFTDQNGSHPSQSFVLDPDFRRSLNLGTKTMANYSTTLGGKKVRYIKYTCTQTGTNTTVSVKLGVNGSTAIPLTLDEATFALKESAN